MTMRGRGAATRSRILKGFIPLVGGVAMPQAALRVMVVSSRPNIVSRLQRQFHSSQSAVVAASREDAIRAVRQQHIAALVVDNSEGQAELIGTIARMHESNRATSIIVLCQPHTELGDFVASAIRAGASAVAIEGYDEFGNVIERAICGSVVAQHADALWRTVKEFTPPSIQKPVMIFINAASEGGNVDAVARTLGVDRRTLAHRFAAVGWPAPSVVSSWCRLLLTVRLFDDASMSVLAVAAHVGYSSASRLRELPPRLLKLTLAEARAIGNQALLEIFRSKANCGPSRVPASGSTVSLQRLLGTLRE